MPTTERTPQRLGDKRIVLRKSKRIAIVNEQVANANLVISAHLQAAPKPRAIDALAAAETQLGKGYAIYGCRCEEVCPKRDCSGLICYACNHVGLPYTCTSSFAFARIGYDAGTLITEEEAIWTPGAIGVRCPFCAPNAIGSNGHIVWMKGDGETTVEEGGRRTGCYRGRATGRGFSLWMKHPALDYATTPMFTDAQERTMFRQVHHYDLDTGKIVGSTNPGDLKDSTIAVSLDGQYIEARDDASIAFDVPVEGDPHRLRRWSSPKNPLPAGVRFTAIVPRGGDAEDPHPGGVALCSDGSTRRFHMT